LSLEQTMKLNPWQPITDKKHLKVLGKFLEELGEAASATARCLIQGIDEAQPVTGKVNRVWLEEEIADVFATAHLVCEALGLSYTDRIVPRMNLKAVVLSKWQDGLLDNQQT
jgi:hypothetical protein